MAKQYKGFKGSGMRQGKLPKYKVDKLVKKCFMEYLANGCKVPKRSDT